MATGGSSSRAASGPRSFDFGSDDVLCSYDDFASQDPSNAKRADPAEKDFRDSRIGRPLVNIYEQEGYMKDDVLPAVEKCMKKYADTLLRSLEGIGGRLSQLEIYCYKLERSIGEFRGDMIRDQSEVDQKLKSLEKHLQEVHRSVQILRDKQELVDAQRELAKLQTVQKDTTKKTEEGTTTAVSESKKLDDKHEAPNQQLALVLSHQANTPSLSRASEPIPSFKDQTVQHFVPASLGMQYQPSPYYPQRQAFAQDTQSELQYVQAGAPIQDPTIQAPPPQLPQIINHTQVTQPQPFPQYQQQLFHQPSHQQLQPQAVQQPPTSQQLPPPLATQPQQPGMQQVPAQVAQPQQIQTQQPFLQPQIRPLAAPPSYPPETFSASMPMPGSYATIPQAGANRPEVASFAYGAPGSAAPQPPPPQHVQRQQLQPLSSQSNFGLHPSKGGYVGAAPYTQPVNVQGYNPPAYSYPPAQQVPHPGMQLVRNHPYGEIIEKAISMGYARDQVLSVAQRMAEGGQVVDFNALLDRLNELGSGVPVRKW